MDNTILQEELSNRLEQIELYFAHWMGRVSLLGLVLLPLVPGSLALASIGTKFPDQLGIPGWLAWAIGGATALGIELLGLIAVRLALKMRRFNRRAVGHEVEPAPLGQGYAAAVLYVGTVLTLTMLLKIWPHAAVYALLPMSLLGALADWIYALSSDQNEREQVLRRILGEQRAAADRDVMAMELRITELTTQLSTMVDRAALDTMSTEHDKLQAECQRLSRLVDNLSLTKAATVDNSFDSEDGDNGVDTLEVDTDNPAATIHDFALWQIQTDGKVNQSEIARLTGFSRPTVKKYVNGLAKVK